MNYKEHLSDDPSEHELSKKRKEEKRKWMWDTVFN